MAKQLILIGGGGHCVACIDVIEQIKGFEIAGIVDVKSRVGMSVCGYPIIGSDDDLPRLTRKYKYFLVTLGNRGEANQRSDVFKKLESLNAGLPVIVSPRAYISKRAAVGEGSIVLHDALVNAGATIGKNVIINTKALIEHDVRVGDHSHVATAAVINGGCQIGEEVFVGSNCVMKQGVTVASGSILGAGSVVIRSLTKSGTYVGNPVRRIVKT